MENLIGNLYFLLLNMFLLDFWSLSLSFWLWEAFVAFLDINSAFISVVSQDDFGCWSFDSQLFGGFSDPYAIIFDEFDQLGPFLGRGKGTMYDIFEYRFLDSNFLMLFLINLLSLYS